MPGEYVLADDSGLTLQLARVNWGLDRTARELDEHGGDRLQTVLAMVASRDREFTMKPGSVSFVTARKWRWATVA